MAKRVPAPSWHLPQVLGRFFAFTMLLGSLEGRMLCTPWQLAQLATVCEPLLAARPWNEESKLTRRSLGMPNLRVRRTSPWQLPHVSRILLTFTGLAALVCFRILCSPWQSVHSGACVTPRASAVPCTLDRNCSTTSVWHMPQVSGTALRKAWDFGGSSSCAPPWRSEERRGGKESRSRWSPCRYKK